MKNKETYTSPTSEVIDLHVEYDCLDETVNISNPNKVTEPGGEINADEGSFDAYEEVTPQTSNLWDE